MLATGGLLGQRVALPASVGPGLSGHMLTRGSAISTDSSDSSFFTTFGGRVAAGLYGPRLWSDRASVAIVSNAGCSPSGLGCCNAAEARTSWSDVTPHWGYRWVSPADSWDVVYPPARSGALPWEMGSDDMPGRWQAICVPRINEWADAPV